jgi:hypothetical protein
MLLLLYQRAEKLLVHKPLNSLLLKKPEGQCSCSAIHSELCDIIILPRIMMREETVYHNFVRQMSCQSSSFSACFLHASDSRTVGQPRLSSFTCLLSFHDVCNNRQHAFILKQAARWEDPFHCRDLNQICTHLVPPLDTYQCNVPRVNALMA